MMNSPIRYFGGKGGYMLGRILSMFPPEDQYHTYVEPFGGSGVILMNKPYKPMEIYNDINRNVYALFTVLTDQELFDAFRRRCELTLYHEKISGEFRELLKDDTLSYLDRAYYFFVVNRTRRNGIGGFSINSVVRQKMSKSTSDFLSAVYGLEDIFLRLKSVVVSDRDGIDLISHWDRDGVMMYLDPPYLHSTRTSTRYENDMTDEEHEKLVMVLKKIRHAKILLSGYNNDLYDTLGWYKKFVDVNTVSGTGKPKTKTEFLWHNYSVQNMGEE